MKGYPLDSSSCNDRAMAVGENVSMRSEIEHEPLRCQGSGTGHLSGSHIYAAALTGFNERSTLGWIRLNWLHET